MAAPPIAIGELLDVPAPQSPVRSAWAQEVTNRVMHRFASIAERDAKWPAATAGKGAMCVTTSSPIRVWINDGAAWQVLTNDELSYTQITASVTVSSTNQAAPTVVISTPSVTYDGSTIMIEFFAPAVILPNLASGQIALNLWDGSTDLGYISVMNSPAQNALAVPVCARRRITPTAGAHTYSVRGWVNANASVQAGTGVQGAYSPAFLRVTRA